MGVIQNKDLQSGPIPVTIQGEPSSAPTIPLDTTLQSTTPPQVKEQPSNSPTPLPSASVTSEDIVSAGAALTATPTASPAQNEGMGLKALVIGLGLTCALLVFLVGIFARALIHAKRKIARRMTIISSNMHFKGLEVGNAHHIGRRGNQEDSFAISDITNDMLYRTQGILAVVADGMGGLADGELISAGVTSCAMREFPSLSPNWSPMQKLHYLVEKANDAGNAVTGGMKNQGGSTMLAALVTDGDLWFASVGDSRICLMRSGSLIPLTRAHIYETDLYRKAAGSGTSFEAAAADSQRRALTSYIGMGELEHLDCSQFPLSLMPGDWVILMTDGIFNELTDEEISKALYGNAPNAAERIENMVLSKGDPHQDNMTVVLLHAT